MSDEPASLNDELTGLVEKAVGGDRAAMGELLYRHADELRDFVARRLGGPVRAVVEVDDVVQDTFALAFRRIESYEPAGDASFMAWLRTIASHRLIDLARSEARQKRGGAVRRVVPANASDTIFSLYEALAATDSTPLRKASREEALRLMHVALAELPPDHRDAIRLRYLEEWTADEVARHLGRTPDAVRGLIRRAKERLKDALGRASSYLSSR
jgi:RNA polymerase sigma-70 factor, ECF subfamily